MIEENKKLRECDRFTASVNLGQRLVKIYNEDKSIDFTLHDNNFLESSYITLFSHGIDKIRIDGTYFRKISDGGEVDECPTALPFRYLTYQREN